MYYIHARTRHNHTSMYIVHVWSNLAPVGGFCRQAHRTVHTCIDVSKTFAAVLWRQTVHVLSERPSSVLSCEFSQPGRL